MLVKQGYYLLILKLFISLKQGILSKLPQPSFVSLHTSSILHPPILFTGSPSNYGEHTRPRSSEEHKGKSPEILHFFWCKKFDNSYSLLVTQSCINCCRCSFSWIWPRFFSRSLFFMCSFFNFLTNCSFSSLSWKGKELKKKNQATFSDQVLIEQILFQIKITSQKFYYGYLELHKGKGLGK